MMNKSIVCWCSVLFIATSITFVESWKKEFRNNMWIINHGFVAPKIISMSQTRPRRWIDSENDVYVSISSWLLKTHRNDKLLVSSKLATHWVASNDPMDSDPVSSVSGDICGVLQGHIHDNEHSRVVMTICGANFYVLFQFDDRSFTVNPVANGSHMLEESRWHSSRNKKKYYLKKMKRDLLGIEEKSIYNLTGDTFHLSNDNEPINVERPPGSDEHESQDYFSDRKWINSKLSSGTKNETNAMSSLRAPGWLELGIAVDYSVIDFHGERVQEYVLALLNIVRPGNARRSLENVNRWNRNVLSSANVAHDVAIWLTRLDIGGPSGYAPVSGVCDPARSCALNRDEGLTSAFIIAHELAHILGLTHDGDETADNFCGREASMGSVMAPMVAATFHRFHWSTCSKREYHYHAEKWTCLNNHPDTYNVTHLREILHDTFTMEEQCRMEFGDGYVLCRSFELPGLCSHLWCSHESAPQVCKTKKGPPLEGTTCGKDKWCVNGYCEPTGRTMLELGSTVSTPREGGWSEWSSWSKCSTTCGVGVQLRTRLCNNPVPSYGGQSCRGSSNDIMICERTKCSSLLDLRREQCNQFSNTISNRTSGKYKMSWLPHLVDDENYICRLTCKNADTGRIYIGNDFVIDGTPCFYNSSNICIQGKCYSMGCDNILNSEKRFDDCGICNGDNSTCITISNKFQRNIRRANTRVLTVPAASHDINIELDMFPTSLAHSATKFIIRDGQGKKYEMRNFNGLNNSSIVIIEGTEFKIRRKLNQYKIVGRGPTLNDIILALRIMDNGRKEFTISINFRYVTDREKENRAMNSSYSWLIGGWSPCTVTCGGGIKRQTIACMNDQIGRIENRKKCLYLPKPVQEIKLCNTFSCEFKWVVAKWEGCTKTCGSQGVQRRQIYCVHSSFPDDEVTRNNMNTVYRTMLPPDICQHHPPEIQRDCNRFPCRGNWIFTEWSICSRSCGQGVQSRMARCVSINGERLFDCDGKSTPDELRPCKNHGRRLIHDSCGELCRRDRSRYCIVPSFNQYCQIDGFRRYCCRTCPKKNNSQILLVE